jgi:methyl-accepting chemotaxis protein
MVAPGILTRLQGAHKTLISDVYFDSTIHMAFVDIYTSITDTDGNMLGLGRSTLKLATIWTAVNNATNAAPGSYAMMVDGNGVRIAYTNRDITLTTQPRQLFQATRALSEQFQQRIIDEDLYGNSYKPVDVLADPVLVANQSSEEGLKTFQLTPALQDGTFQAVQATCKVVPWRYIVLRPVNTITQAANQQNSFLIVLALVITLLAGVAGLLLGRAITKPILRSVSSLTQSSEMLKKLSASEQVTANEQKWIVESSQSGLKTVEYYTGASGFAARKLFEIGQDLSQHMNRMDIQAIQRHLNEIVAAASYIEKATDYQEQSSRSLSTAIRITTQVTDQLVSGATSAADASKQLEDVILELRQVIGG